MQPHSLRAALETDAKLASPPGHTVILAWCESSRGIAQLTRILTQLCAANRGDNGGVVVVLTQHVRGRVGHPVQGSRQLGLCLPWSSCCPAQPHGHLSCMQRGKLEMEELFREVVPLQHRFGTKAREMIGRQLQAASLHPTRTVAAGC